MAKLTIRQAAKAVGRDRTTLYRYIQDGTLSVEAEHRGKDTVRVVDTAELERVFGPLIDSAQQSQAPQERPATTATSPPEHHPGFAVAVSSLQQQVQLLQQQIDRSEGEKADLRGERDRLLSMLEKAQHQIAQLTDQRQVERRPWWRWWR